MPTFWKSVQELTKPLPLPGKKQSRRTHTFLYYDPEYRDLAGCWVGNTWLKKVKSARGVDNPGMLPHIWFHMTPENKKAESERFQANRWGMYAKDPPVANQKSLRQIGVDVPVGACPAPVKGQHRPPAGEGLDEQSRPMTP